MRVLSLFDGMSCGQIALNRIGLPITEYYASEIDKYAIAVTTHNYPETIHLGDVTKVKAKDLPEIDLLIGGSPCQGFSFAGKQKGASTSCNIEITTLDQYLQLKEDGFEFNGQSYLFWEYMRLLKEVKPKCFLLENVKMSKKWEAVLNEAIGLEPIKINSALVSAQNRVRLYWTNIPNVGQPKDRGILLKDVLESGDTVAAIRGRYIVDGKRQDHKMKTAGLTTQRLETRNDGKSNCLTTVQKDNVVISNLDEDASYRKLTPLEYERLQTVPDNYTLVVQDGKQKVSNSQRYKMLGNGWTIDIIADILAGIKS